MKPLIFIMLGMLMLLGLVAKNAILIVVLAGGLLSSMALTVF